MTELPPELPRGGLVGLTEQVTAAERRRRLVERLGSGQPLVLPGVTDVLGLRLVEQVGFTAAYATGAGLANAQFGLPDVGLITLTEVVEQARRLADATRLPLIVDIDDGYGGVLSTMRTVHLHEQAGAAALQLEDQAAPKRCGHFDSHRLISADEMCRKIVAAVNARRDPDLLLIARTDARSAYDFDEALLRAHAYAEAGADLVFVEALRTDDELATVGKELVGTPLVVNVVEGGKTPEHTVDEYRELGFTVMLFANFLMRSMMYAGRVALRHLYEHGETLSVSDRLASWDDRQSLFNLEPFGAAETALDAVVAARGRPHDETT